EPEAVRHDALIGLPALARDELEERSRLLPAAEEQIKELIDEGIIGRQRISCKHQAGHCLQQAALETGTRALNRQGPQAMRIPSRELEAQDSTKGDTQKGRTFQIMPVQKFSQVRNQVLQIEAAPQREAIIFAAELIADHPEMSGQQSGQGTEKSKAASQAWNDYERGSFAPFPVFGRVVLEMTTTLAAFAGAELGSACSYPLCRCSHRDPSDSSNLPSHAKPGASIFC